MAAFDTSIASVVLPVPTSPVNHRPRPSSSRSPIARTYARTSRISAGLRRSIEATGSRSNETSRNRFGSRPATAAARLRAIRAGRHEHGRARGPSSSKRKPEPSQRLSGQAPQYPSSPAYDMNRGNSFWNASSTVPSPPLRCLEMIRSAIPSCSESSW